MENILLERALVPLNRDVVVRVAGSAAVLNVWRWIVSSASRTEGTVFSCKEKNVELT